jgi:transglutaminase-like putative cysteine protease
MKALDYACHSQRRHPGNNMKADTLCVLLPILYLCGLMFIALGTEAIAPALALEKEYAIGPPPEWVERIAPVEEAAVPVGQVSQGVYYLLNDVQTRVEAHDRFLYRHFAMKAINESGVEEIAHVEVPFDPAYQTLTLHSINVRRGGRVISKLNNAAAVRVLQREKELEYRIYDGSKTANVFLDDVRVGDVVEYAYTLRGANPVFRNRLFGQFDLQWKVPVHSLNARLLWPSGREVYLAHHNTELRPSVRERGRYREYRWQARGLSALVVEAGAPGWYDPYAWVQWSEFKDWEAVARWAQPLYRVPDRLGSALQTEIERISRLTAAPDERLLAVLHFVQHEIRYLGVEIGAGSHAPNPPQLVLERRFGDCKDKSLLTVTMLRSLGIEAQPALVNTSLRRGIRDLQPTPAVFNHVLVRARLDGRDYWLDPTRSPQKGDLAHLYQPDYGYALVVDAATRELSPMPGAAASVYKRTIHAVFDSRDGLEQPVRYTVTSILEGASAEALRSTLASENREELQKQYLNFYAGYYPNIQMKEPFAVAEEESANRLTLTEQYVIPNFWKHSDKMKRLEAEIYSPDVDDCLQKPRESVRSAPLSVAYPVDLTHTTEVLLPETWAIKPEQNTVDDPAFHFERVISAKDKLLVLADRFLSRVDHVAPSDTARYAANLEHARDEVGYRLYKYDESPPAAAHAGLMDRFNWSVATIAFLVILFSIWLAEKLYRYNPPRVAAPLGAGPAGVGGWLVLPSLGIVAFPVRLLTDVIKSLPTYAADTWATLTTVGNAAYHPMWAPILLYELSANLAQVVFSILLVVLLFQKRRSVPRVFIGVMGGSAFIQAVDLLLADAIPSARTFAPTGWMGFIGSIMGLAVWGTYFMVSRRVKSTFVNGLNARHPSMKRPDFPVNPDSQM